jgi:DNA-binding transcriptional LysR family regulator
MNLGHLAIFHAVAEEKSVTRGAERLMVSQPAVSKQLRLLEQNLGATLLERQPRGIKLTHAGELLLGYARKIFALEEEAVRALDELRGLHRGRLAIGASTTIGIYLLPEIFVEFRKCYPAIDVTLEVGSSRHVLSQLAEGSIDMGLVESAPEEGNWDAKYFMKDALVAIANPRHPILAQRRIPAEAFCRQPFIARSTGSDTKSFVEEELAGRGLVVKPVMALGTNEAVKRAVAAGIGVAIVSHLSIGMELKASTLAVVKVAGLSIHRLLYRITRKDTTPSSAMAKFSEMLPTAAFSPLDHRRLPS